MLACKQPYNVNVAAEAMARAALEHRDKILVTVRSLSAELEKTIAFVKTFRFLKPHPSSPPTPPSQSSLPPAPSCSLPPCIPRSLILSLSLLLRMYMQ